MKSLFKRSLAAATGSVLALTQLAVIANVNISAVDTAAPAAASETATGTAITMDEILKVPVSSADFLNAKFETLTDDEDNSVEVALVGHTNVGNTLGTALMSAGDKQKSVVAQNIRNKAKSVLTRGGYLSAAEVAEIVNKISDADVVITADGTATAEISLGEIGPVVGPAFERFVQKMTGIDFNDPEATIDVDWSKFSIAGKIVIEAEADFPNNTVTYTTTITDENGKQLADSEAIVEYAVDKLTQAADLTLNAARKTKEEKAAQLADYQKQWAEKQAEKNDADADVAAKQAELDEAVAELDKAEKDGADDATIAEKRQDAADAQAKLDDAKAKLADAQAKLDDAKAQLDDGEAQLAAAEDKLEKADEQLNNGKEKIRYANQLVEAVAAINETDVTLDGIYTSYLADLEGIVKKADLSATRKNQILNQIEKWTPATASSAFSNEKVQNYYDKAVNAYNNAFGNIATIDVALADVQAVITNAEAQTKKVFEPAYEIDGYSANALLYIDDDAQRAELVEAAAAAMTPMEFVGAGWTVVLENEDGELLTEENYDETAEYEIIDVIARKKITASAETDYLMNGTLKFDVERLITQIVVHKTEVTTTTTTTTTDESTTTTTSTTVETTSTTVTSSTDVTTSTTPEGGDSTTTTTTTSTDVEPGTTTAATYVSFEIEGVEQEGLIYWSEETTDFDLSDLSITLRIFENGVATDVQVDVSDAFDLEYHSPADMEMPEEVGVYGATVFFILKDADAVKQAILDAGYDQDLIDQEGIEEGYEAGSIVIYLVHRGDANLDGIIDLRDAMYALQYYTETVIIDVSATQLFADPNRVYLNNKGDKAEAYFPYSHYAADAKDGNGLVDLMDAITILSYYTENVVIDNPSHWDDLIQTGGPVVPRDDLHANPLGRDPQAKDYADKDIDHSVAE